MRIVQTEIGIVEYTFTTTDLRECRKVFILFNKQKKKFALSGNALTWASGAPTYDKETDIYTFRVIGTSKVSVVTNEQLESITFMYGKLGNSVSRIYPNTTLTEFKILPPVIKDPVLKKGAYQPKKKLAKKPVAINNKTENLTVMDFVEGPLDPNIPLSKQYNYIKAWRKFKAATK